MDSSIKYLLDSLWLLNQPHKRIYFLNLIATVTIAFIFYFLTSYKSGFFKRLPRDISRFFSKSYLFHHSSIMDFKIFIFNGFFKSIFILPWLWGTMEVSSLLLKVFRYSLPAVEFIKFDTALNFQFLLILFTVLSFVIGDFLRFFQHFLMHKVSFLWRIHSVHHSAEVLTPMTLYRIHPIEMMISLFRGVLASSLSVAIFIFIFRQPVGGLDILGVNALGFIFNFTFGNLRHAHFPISFGVLEYLFISPAQHQLHHSKDENHFDKNFGVALSIWDLCLGTFVKAQKNHTFSFGVKGRERKNLKFYLIGTLFKK